MVYLKNKLTLHNNIIYSVGGANSVTTIRIGVLDNIPTMEPTNYPSKYPSNNPSNNPTNIPTNFPSNFGNVSPQMRF